MIWVLKYAMHRGDNPLRETYTDRNKLDARAAALAADGYAVVIQRIEAPSVDDVTSGPQWERIMRTLDNEGDLSC
jgi:hypothetical protein